MKTQNNQDHSFDPLHTRWEMEDCDDELRPGQENWLAVYSWFADDEYKRVFSLECIESIVERVCGKNAVSQISFDNESEYVIIVNPNNENAIAMVDNLVRQVEFDICLNEEAWKEHMKSWVDQKWNGESLLVRMRCLPYSANFADALERSCPDSAWSKFTKQFGD